MVVAGWAGGNEEVSILPCSTEVKKYVHGLQLGAGPTGLGARTGSAALFIHSQLSQNFAKDGRRRSDAAGQAIPKLPAEPGVKSLRVNPPLCEGNLNAQAARLMWLALLPLLLPQKFTNAVAYGNGSPESISALLQFVLS